MDQSDPVPSDRSTEVNEREGQVQGLLAQVHEEYERQGWSISDLHSFRMEGEEDTDDAPPVDDGSQGSEDYSFGGDFLQRVPEEHRTILEPYVKQWDAGVTRRFQELHSEYEPYKSLEADPEVLAQAYQLYQLIDTQPQQVFELLKNALGIEEQGLEPEEEEVPGGFQDLPPELMKRLERQDAILTALAENFVSGQRTAAEQAEDEELDQTLQLLKTEFGDFDEEYVLAKVFHGASWEDAVKAYMKLAGPKQTEEPTSQPQRQLPKILSGGGVVPAEAQNPADLSRKDVKDFVANIMAQANQG